MEKIKRKQLILPQDKLNAVKKILNAKTDTEAVILSLDTVLRQKKLKEFAALKGKVKLSLTPSEIKKMRQ